MADRLVLVRCTITEFGEGFDDWVVAGNENSPELSAVVEMLLHGGHTEQDQNRTIVRREIPGCCTYEWKFQTAPLPPPPEHDPEF